MRMILDTKTIIERFRKIHGDRYDYTYVEYKKDTGKLHIICHLHGSFYQSHLAHYRGKQGCPKCGIALRQKSQSSCLQSLIDILPDNIKDKLDFTYAMYKNMHEPICVMCKTHNKKYYARPADVFYKYRIYCPECISDTIAERQKQYSDYIYNKTIGKACVIHNNRYKYERLSDFKNAGSKLHIECPFHGWFDQTANDHIYGGCGCPVCKMSHGESKIAIYLDNNNIEHKYQYRVKIDKSYHWFDFYIPTLNLIVSYNGKQHYQPIKFFGGKRGYKILLERDNIKNDYCNQNNIKHLIISHNEFNIIEDILKKHLRII